MQISGLRSLLDLNGQIIDQENGFWIKIESWQVAVTHARPHGIRYALSLHAPDGQRILGYDNAHAVRVRGMKYAGQRLPFDHRHRHASDKGEPYQFVDAYQLLSDFFEEADSVLKEWNQA
jgi:hypothetical protein